MATIQQVELGVLGPLRVRRSGLPVAIPGAKPRAVLTMLGLHAGSVVAADVLVELLWGDDPPRTAAKALQTHVAALRRALGDGFVVTQGTGWTLSAAEIDATRYRTAVTQGRDAMTAGNVSEAVTRFDEAIRIWRGTPELPDGRRGRSEMTRWVEGHAAVVEDRADALLAAGRAAEIVGELEAAIADAPLRERRWGQLMLALYRAGRQGEALGAYRRARALLADQLGVDPGPDLRRLEAAIVSQDVALELPATQHTSSVMRAVTFLLTDIVGSTAAWEADADAMAAALARHDEIVERVVTFRGGRLIKTRGEGDATFSVFDRPSAAAAAAIELQGAIGQEQWDLAEPMRIRVALHTGEVEFRDGDYFGRAVNRAARLRSLASGDQILCSGATAELVVDSLADDVVLVDLGTRQLKNLARPEHVFELRLAEADDARPSTDVAPLMRPAMPAVLAGPGPFVGRGAELDRLVAAWDDTLTAGIGAVLIAGEPGVGKTRLAGEWSRRVHELGAVVLYGRCDEDLGAPYQPFAEAMRSLVPCLGPDRLRGLRGVEAVLPLVPGLTDVVPDLAPPPRADADTERYALFDAVVGLLGIASASAPVILVLDDLHWATKPTLLLLRHVLRFGDRARVQIIGTYRSTDLDRAHPLAAMLADLHRDGTALRLALAGLDQEDVTAYVTEAGYDDGDLAVALATVTGGNPFFLIEALRHVEESGGRWDPSTLPQGVREAVSRRLSRLPVETNKALAAAAVVGSRFSVELVEKVVSEDLVDAFDEASKAGIVIEEQGGRYRFNHALVRQSLLAELAAVRRMRLHQKIAAAIESEPGADDEHLAELAHHYFECAWAGNAGKAVDYCRRAADQAMARLAYEGAADLYDKALHALEELDDELPDRDDQQAELLIARCEALLAAGDVASAAGAVAQLLSAAGDSVRLAAWGTCFDGQLSMLTDPERLNDIEVALGLAAEQLADLEDPGGEAKAHTVRAGCLARLGRIGDCETALDQALTAARRARDHRRVNEVLAGAPLAALWGPNPVPRAGGRCLDVVRLLRITTGSPVVEATSTRCQGVLDAFRGRAAAGRQLIDSARRTLTELGMRHALLEVEQFAGIIELVADDVVAAEAHLRRAYEGFRRMGLDADTADTAALLARACLVLGRFSEADELCSESERLAGHALKPSIAWRTVRAQLLSRSGDVTGARRVAEEAVAIAERTDELVDHGDACLALATVLRAAGDSTGARAAAGRAAELYELKGAAALVEKAKGFAGVAVDAPESAAAEQHPAESAANRCVSVIARLDAAYAREAWDEVGRLMGPTVAVESRRKIVGFPRAELSFDEWLREGRRYRHLGTARHRHGLVAVRGQRHALTRVQMATVDTTPGAPEDDMLLLYGLDANDRIASQVWFDVDDLDSALAELDTQSSRNLRPSLGNAASRAFHSLARLFSDGDWEALSRILSPNIVDDDRRHVVNAGVRRGLGTVLATGRAAADTGTRVLTASVVATRGDRSALCRTTLSERVARPGAFQIEFLSLVEVDVDDNLVAHVAFDLDDFDGAMAELDARYAAGEAAPHAGVWSAIARNVIVFNMPDTTAWSHDTVIVDHRRITAFAEADQTAYVRATREQTPDLRMFVEAVHVLAGDGAVVQYVAKGTSDQQFDAEWRGVAVSVVDGDRISRGELYDLSDLDAALARFDELVLPAMHLANDASRTYARFVAEFVRREWDAMRDLVAEEVRQEDRRRVVNGGIRQGRDAFFAEMQSLAVFELDVVSSTTLATRGSNLALHHSTLRMSAGQSDAYENDVVDVIETDAAQRVVARVIFDADDLDAAFAELDARYVRGEAAPYAQSWGVVAGNVAAFNRHEFPSWTSDAVTIDHRSVTAFAPGERDAYVRATWAQTPDLRMYVDAVHRLSEAGAVISYFAKGTSEEHFEAEWRGITLTTLQRGQIHHTEHFDRSDLGSALARFDELTAPKTELGNSASRVYERYLAEFMAGDWDALAETLAEGVSNDDRRRVVNGGVQHGRDAVLANMRAIADVGVTNFESSVLAVRGDRVALGRHRVSGGSRPEAFGSYVLIVVEIDADDRFAAGVAFDPEDIDAAYTELDERYLRGEAAPFASAWSVIVDGYAAFNRGELGSATEDFASVDHRRGARFAPGDLFSYLSAAWDDSPGTRIRVDAVHRLTEHGAVVTHSARGASRDGFDAEWHDVAVTAVVGDAMSRIELFDLGDLDGALARFDELHPVTGRPENAASLTAYRLQERYADRDWNALAELFSEETLFDDRRRLLNVGRTRGRGIAVTQLRVASDAGTVNSSAVCTAIRGDRLALGRFRYWGRDEHPEQFFSEFLAVVEVDDDQRIVARVVFDLDDLDAAFAELDARYLAGEAAAHAATWTQILETYTRFNRHELSKTTPDWVNVDHRRGVAPAPGDMNTYVSAIWSLVPDVHTRIEAVHRLNDLGAVFSHTERGTSRDGFDAEWREIALITFDGDAIDRCELYDEVDLDAALEHFDELSRPRFGNAARLAYERFWSSFAQRNWDAMAEVLADGTVFDDRRRVVNAGVRRGRDAGVADMRAIADLWAGDMRHTLVATRGDRLALSRVWSSTADTRVLNIAEVDDEHRIAALVAFDPDDADSAISELDARFLEGEAAAHAHVWTVIAGATDAFNRHEPAPTTADCIVIDHRLQATIAAGDSTGLADYLHASWDLTPDLHAHIETVHALNDRGVVVTTVTTGSSADGFRADWRQLTLMTVSGDLGDRCEIFDESDLDAALARFDELTASPRLNNSATDKRRRVAEALNRRDLDGVLAHSVTNGRFEDRRKGLRDTATGPGFEKIVRALFEVTRGWLLTTEAVAVRGTRLAITRDTYRDSEHTVVAEHLTLTELGDDDAICYSVLFDADDFDAAIAELDARYLAGEAAAHARTWSASMLVYTAANRHQPPEWADDFESIDHRRAFPPGELVAYLEASWAVAPGATIYVEAVHRLTDAGVLLTYVSKGASDQGFDAEWRGLTITMFANSKVARSELFDESDLDAALARFDQLTTPTKRLTNAASRMYERFNAAFEARDWDAMADIVADDTWNEDRRRVVNGGVQRSRDAVLENMRAVADVGVTTIELLSVIATRGDRLALTHQRYSVRRQPGVFDGEVLIVAGVDTDERFSLGVAFDLDDLDAALAELEARYLAGEAAACARTWATVAQCFQALHAREFPRATADFVDVDHRSGARIDSGDLRAYLSAAYEDMAENRLYVESVHRLSELGAVVTHVARGTTHGGLSLEWRLVDVVTVDGDLVNRCEMFDEADVDAALARFDELRTPAKRLANMASRVGQRFVACYAAHDWSAMSMLLADDHVSEDRRGVVNLGIQRGSDAHIATMRATVEVGFVTVAHDVVATRGERLVLSRVRASGSGRSSAEIDAESLGLVEIDVNGLVVSTVIFDPDDLDGAFAELDARYVAGVPSGRANTWSVISAAYAGMCRGELPPTAPDLVNIDHRTVARMAPGEGLAYLRASWDLASEFELRIESVHRLTERGAVFSRSSTATSREGFDAEWRAIDVMLVENGVITRGEFFDPGDVDVALARFDELGASSLRASAATAEWRRVADAINRRDIGGVLEHCSANGRYEDRRKGLRNAAEGSGLEGVVRALFEVATGWLFETDSIGVRGTRLALGRDTYRGPDDTIFVEHLTLIAVDHDDLVCDIVLFDPDDLDVAFADLDARYLAGEAAAHAHAWSLIVDTYAAWNRHELSKTTTDWVSVDHRRGVRSVSGDINAYVREFWSLVPDARTRIEAVHRLSDLGAVFVHAESGTSREGFGAEWREVTLLTVDGDAINRLEVFDEDDLDTALARFDELTRDSERGDEKAP